MDFWQWLLICGSYLVLLFWSPIACVELTFELPDNAKECFFQEIKKNQSATLEFQVSPQRNYNF